MSAIGQEAESPAVVAPGSDDYTLLRAIAESRDPSALKTLYDRHAGLVFTLCHGVLRDRADAEELLVDIFWELWDKADRYDESRGSPLTYLTTLARSRAIDRLRTRRARAGAGGPPVALASDDRNVPPVADNPIDRMAGAERRASVRAAMAQLEPVQRQAIECAYYDGLSHSEIAAKLDKPLGSVKTWIRQGLIRLRDSLRTSFEEPTNQQTTTNREQRPS